MVTNPPNPTACEVFGLAALTTPPVATTGTLVPETRFAFTLVYCCASGVVPLIHVAVTARGSLGVVAGFATGVHVPSQTPFPTCASTRCGSCPPDWKSTLTAPVVNGVASQV